MGKYFINIEQNRLKLSMYKNTDNMMMNNSNKNSIIDYLLSILGDVELSEQMFLVIYRQFYCYSGMYNVKTKPETIRGMYNMIQKYSYLSSSAIDELWPKYIDDLFKIYSLDEKLADYIEMYGFNDEAFDQYILYVNKMANILQKEYENDASKVYALKKDYSNNFINYLRMIILREHIKYEKIYKNIPDSSIIYNDEKQLNELSTFFRVHFGVGYPISYKMVKSMAENGNLNDYDEQPEYYLDLNRVSYKATFTKSEFLKKIKILKEK